MSKAVMTIHGFLTDTKDFGRLYDYLGFYDEVVPYKVPGHNDGEPFDKFNKEYTIAGILRCFDELAAKYDEVDVVGFSMGGALTTYLCARRPVHKAVLVSPSNKYFNLNSPVAMIRFYLKYILRRVKARAAGQKDDGELKRYWQNSAVSAGIAVKRILPGVDLHTFGVFSDLMEIADKAVEEKAPIDTPTLLLWGELDELVPLASVEFVENRFSNLTKFILPDVGHAMLYTNRDNEIIERIVDFLSDGTQHPVVPFENKV